VYDMVLGRAPCERSDRSSRFGPGTRSRSHRSSRYSAMASTTWLTSTHGPKGRDWQCANYERASLLVPDDADINAIVEYGLPPHLMTHGATHPFSRIAPSRKSHLNS